MLNEKKITKTQYCDILNMKKVRFSWLFNFFITQQDKGFYVIAKVKNYFLPIAFIIDLITNFFYCLWNEGLKNFDISMPLSINNYIFLDTPPYKRAMKYWKN